MSKNQTEVLDAEWYDQNETMKRLNLAMRTLREWVTKGRIRTKTHPQNTRQRLYKAADVEKLAQDRPAPEPRQPQTAAVTAAARPVKQRIDALEVFKLFSDEVRAYLKESKENEERRAREQNALVWLTIAEAAAVTRLPKAYIHRAIGEGKLPAIKAGAWRIRRASLEAFAG